MRSLNMLGIDKGKTRIWVCILLNYDYRIVESNIRVGLKCLIQRISVTVTFSEYTRATCTWDWNSISITKSNPSHSSPYGTYSMETNLVHLSWSPHSFIAFWYCHPHFSFIWYMQYASINFGIFYKKERDFYTWKIHCGRIWISIREGAGVVNIETYQSHV